MTNQLLTTNNLLGENILITRPDISQAPLSGMLSNHGANPVTMSCMSIVPVEENSVQYGIVKQHILDLDLFDIVICVSINAAKLAGDLIDQYWPQLPINPHWFAIGLTTARTLAQFDVQATVAQGLNQSEELLAHDSLQSIAGKKVLILKGNSGRELLSETLLTRSAFVTEAVLYKRDIPVYTDLQINDKLYQSSLSAIFITSGDALKNLMKIAKGSLRQFDIQSLLSIKLFVPSSRVATIAKAFGYQHIFVVDAADDQSMLAKLLSIKSLEAKNEKAK